MEVLKKNKLAKQRWKIHCKLFDANFARTSALFSQQNSFSSCIAIMWTPKQLVFLFLSLVVARCSAAIEANQTLYNFVVSNTLNAISTVFFQQAQCKEAK
jgi:hypothetical protein